MALTALRESSDRREVIVPAYTCPLVPLAIVHCGLKVRVCGTRAGHFDFDPEQLAAACSGNTLAIIPTHLGGRIADVVHACEVARAHGAWVIEDAAQAWGARIGDAPVGLAGDVGFFSLAVGKGITLYEGGVLVARDPVLREQLRETGARTIPFRPGWELRRIVELLGYTALYRPSGLRLAYGLPRRRALAHGDWIAAVGDAFSSDIPLHRVSRWRRRVGERAATRWPAHAAQLHAQAQRRIPLLEKLPGVQVLKDPDGASGAWPFFLLRLATPAARDAVLDSLAASHFGVSRLFVHALPDYAYLHGCVDSDADVPNARAFAAQTLTVSNSPWLDDAAFAELLERMDAALGSHA